MNVAKYKTLQLLPGAIPEIFASSVETGTLTVADRYGLMAATLDEFLGEEERRAVDRMLRAVARGRIKVTQQISTAICPIE